LARRTWVKNPNSGEVRIPDVVQQRTHSRLQRYAEKHFTAATHGLRSVFGLSSAISTRIRNPPSRAQTGRQPIGQRLASNTRSTCATHPHTCVGWAISATRIAGALAFRLQQREIRALDLPIRSVLRSTGRRLRDLGKPVPALNIRRCQSGGEIEGESSWRVGSESICFRACSARWHPKCSAYARERFLPPSVGWIGCVGHDGSDRCTVTAPAEDIPEQCVILAKPLQIADQQLRRDPLVFVAYIHNDQSSMFDPSESVGHRPVLDRLRRQRRADSAMPASILVRTAATSSGFLLTKSPA